MACKHYVRPFFPHRGHADVYFHLTCILFTCQMNMKIVDQSYTLLSVFVKSSKFTGWAYNSELLVRIQYVQLPASKNSNFLLLRQQCQSASQISTFLKLLQKKMHLLLKVDIFIKTISFINEKLMLCIIDIQSCISRISFRQ